MQIIKKITLSAVFLLAFAICAAAQNITVNPGAGSYTTLSAAFAAVNAGTHTGAVTVSIDADTTEPSAGAILNASGTGSASYTSITITPTGARAITGAATAGLSLIDLNGADNVTINGLNTGGNSLTISNTTVSTTSGTATIRFINDANGNTITNSTVNGAATGASTGTILFSSATTTGNDGNTITACNIGPVAATFPLNSIQSIGTTTSQATRNSGIQITNNNIFDFFNAASVANGILASGSTDWTITGNSLYQTATRTFTAAGGFIGISMADTSGVNFTISNNFVGGSAPSAGGAAWTQTGAFSHTFIGIRMSVGTATASSLQNNVIRNLSISTSTTATTSAGISAVTGAMNVGTTTGNTVGATTGTGSIVWTGAGTAAQFAGILAGTGTPGGIAISNNNIGSIIVAGAGMTTLYGIRFSGAATAAYTVSGNIIGSITTANSITSNSNLGFVGISGSQTAFAASVTNNTIQNLQHTSTGTAASLRGIELLGSISNQNISGNTIANYSTASTNTGTTGTAAVNGIVLTGSATSGNTITANTIRDLASTTAGATAVFNNGITITGTPGTTMNRNFIFNLSVASTSASSAIQGIYLFNSSATENIVNNMMRLGTGLSTSINPIIRGIRDNSATGSPTNIFFNSIFIDGTQGGATVNTTGIARDLASTMDLRDNILWNNRASTGAPGAQTGRHYAIINSSTTGTFTSNYNDLYTPNNGGAIGQSGGLDRITLANWQTATSQDLNSINSDPLFIDATNATAPNLHIQTGSPARNIATNVGVGNDFDNENRPGANALLDIGADEADGVAPVANDIAATAIVVPVNGATILFGTVITPQATFTNVGTATQTNVSVQFTITGPGGYSYANTQTIATIAPNQVATVTFATAPAVTAVGTFITTATVLTADGNAANNSVSGTFTVPTPIAGGTYNVPDDYPSLTNAGGIFAALNAAGASGNIVINIAADLTDETGANALNQLGAGITVTIKPDGGARIISGAAASTALIRLNGASNVTIDGSLAGGTDRSLTIENTSTTAPTVIRFGSIGTAPITNNVLKNSIVRNGVNTNSAITVLDTAGTLGGYFNNITIQNNDVQRAFRGIFLNAIVTGTNGSGTLITANTLNTAGANSIRLNPIFVAGANGVNVTNNTLGNISNANAEVPVAIVLSTGTNNAVVSGNIISGIVSTSTSTTASASGMLVSVGAASTSISVTNNTISNITSAGTSVSHYGIASFSPNVSITGNTVTGMTQTGANASFGIVLAGATNNTVSQNTVSAMTSNATSVTSGIQVQGGSTNVVFERNRVFNIKNTNTIGYGANGIQLTSTSTTANITVRNNFVYDVAAVGFAGSDVADNGYGIIVTSGAGYNVWNNSVNMNTNQTATTGLPAAFNVLAAVTVAAAIDLRNNIFNNSQTIGTQRYAIYSGAANTVFSAIDYNDYLTTGPNLGFIGSNRATLADIQTGFGGNANSLSIDPLFVSATDLHLQATSPARNVGTPIAGVTNDFDNQARPNPNDSLVVQVDIGADEYYVTPTAAGSDISGRVVTANGQGIRNATVMLSGGRLTQPIYVQTGSFGSYRFEGLPSGETYVLTVISKKYSFSNPSLLINLNENVADADFTAGGF